MFLLAFIQAALAPAPLPADSVDILQRAALRAEARYEYLARQLAPISPDWPSRGPCDEIVGRFCLRFTRSGETPRPLRPEPPPVLAARREAVQALRLAFAADPSDRGIASTLVRFLVEDERAEEAVATARTFAWATTDSIWGPLLLGFALHHAGDSESEARIESALARMPTEERRRILGVRSLLHPDERRVYDALDEADRDTYEAAFWRLANPLYLLAWNEHRVEHVARWVWARMLEDLPRVAGTHRWGPDLEELTARFGVPVRRERVDYRGFQSIPLNQLIVERYDPDQLSLAPEALRTKGVPAAPLPGEPSPLEIRAARSRHAPVALRRLLTLDHQVSRFPAGDRVALRVDGFLPLDSVARESGPGGRSPTAAQGGLFVLDDDYRFVTETRRRAPVRRDTVRLTFQTELPPGDYQYSLEALLDDTRLAGRARYPVELPGPAAEGPAMSDVVVTAPFGEGRLPDGRDDPAMQARAGLIIGRGETVGLFAEVHGLTAGPDGRVLYDVELSVHKAGDEAPLPVRAIRWLGRTLNILGEPERPRLSWQAEGDPARPTAIAVDLDLGRLRPDLYAVRLTVTDRVGGHIVDAERIVRIAAED